MWFGLHPEQTGSSLGRCLLEKAKGESGAPDLVLYLGDDYPQWQTGELQRVDLNRWRPPDLVGEIADTSLASDLDEKKQLYAALGISEYWVVDVRGQQVFAFQLQPDGKYGTDPEVVKGFNPLLTGRCSQVTKNDHISSHSMARNIFL